MKQIKEVFTSKLNIREPFMSLFPVDEDVYRAIKKSMLHGFDPSKPIDVWKEEGVILDGHTRHAVAKERKIRKVPIYEHSFPDEDSALMFAVLNQKNRRNLDKERLFFCIEKVYKILQKEKEVSKDTSNIANKTAKAVGVGKATVKRVRYVNVYGDEGTKKAVRNGDISIRKAAQITQEKQAIQPISPTFNRTNENIEWARWSWNPVTGCQMGCEYCYARDIANRFYKQKFKPTFHEHRLEIPRLMKVPAAAKEDIGEKNCFVCSMADLFGNWVPKDWILKVLSEVEATPDWNYLFLTKNPKRYLEFEFPKNAWLGTTVDYQRRVKKAEKVFSKLKATVKFLSCEPMMEPLEFSNLKVFDWVIVGGASESSQTPKFHPEWEWVESLLLQARRAKCMVYFKPNLASRPREYPSNL